MNPTSGGAVDCRIKYDYRVHPCAELFPEMSADEFQQLEVDIAVYGLLEPIMLSQDGETILDGRSRLRACQEIGIDPRAVRFTADMGAEEDFIWAKNFLRRNLTDDQRAAIAIRCSDAEKAAAKERQRQHGGTAPGRPGNTSVESNRSVREILAERAHVSTDKVRQVELLAKHAPDLLSCVASGKLKLKDAVRDAARRVPPLEFPELDANIETDHQCDACGYEWNGGENADESEDELGDPDAKKCPMCGVTWRQNPARHCRQVFFFSEWADSPEAGAKLFAEKLVALLKNESLLPFFDSRGKEFTLEIRDASLLISSKEVFGSVSQKIRTGLIQ